MPPHPTGRPAGTCWQLVGCPNTAPVQLRTVCCTPSRAWGSASSHISSGCYWPLHLGSSSAAACMWWLWRHLCRSSPAGKLACSYMPCVCVLSERLCFAPRSLSLLIAYIDICMSSSTHLAAAVAHACCKQDAGKREHRESSCTAAACCCWGSKL